MLTRELLLEYQRAVTASKLGQALRARFRQDVLYGDNTARLLDSNIERRLGDEHKAGRYGSVPQQHEFIIDCLLEELEDLIPEKFIPWAVQLYIRKGVRSWEDFYKAGDYIEYHMKLRQTGYFKRHPEDNQLYGDIMRFKSLSDLGRFVMAVRADEHATTSNAEKERQYEASLYETGQAELVYDDGEFKVTIPKTQEAAVYLGRNTQWCTSAAKDNQFYAYHGQGPLYIILHKRSNRRWQAHFETGQFMNENDESDSMQPYAHLFEKDVFNLSRLNGWAVFNMMTHRGFPSHMIDRILAKQSRPVLAAICLKAFDYLNREMGSGNMGTQLHTIAAFIGGIKLKPKRKVVGNIEVLDFGKEGANLLIYAFQKDELGTLLAAEFMNVLHRRMRHLETDLADVKRAAVFIFEGKRRLYYARAYGDVVTLADTDNENIYSMRDLDVRAKPGRYDAPLYQAVLAFYRVDDPKGYG